MPCKAKQSRHEKQKIVRNGRLEVKQDGGYIAKVSATVFKISTNFFEHKTPFIFFHSEPVTQTEPQ